MNYANLYRIINACLKLDHVSSQKLLQNWCKKQQFENLKFSFSSYTRNYCSADGTTQAHKDDITVLPSPQEASKTPNISVTSFYELPTIYIAASLLPQDLLKKYMGDASRETLIETFNDRLVDIPRNEQEVGLSLETSIMKFDSDLSKEVLDQHRVTGVVNPKNLSVAMSGAVACVCHVNGPHLYVANVGDCNAVIGTMVEEDEWIANKITTEHNTENYEELKRIWSEHPENEMKTSIRRDRLLGELAPLRSLGDYRYKWSVKTLTEVAVPMLGQRAIPANYHTPPYLSAKPDIYYHRLTPKDKFLIIASDGIWDMMTPLQSVRLVGEHMKGKVFFNPLKLPKKNIQLGDIDELLSHRRESLKSKPKDRNAATHLIRHAIGGTEYGVDHARLAHLLSLAPDVSRMFRDDMTVTVVYFDSEHLRQCPS
ncbi:[Pyruvate dehydrogenase [acetyl-transferring]]-phosphatase 1, mitochondrial [Operophtera brumata]|uniref:[Pyruvate dehydrogenase [acetyl-transferring]]-phosphatase 1, mitochondrial n=1 Tax=Operophtera brumata TaxID=104452 RepID=A0A0L7LRB1_OPEBR|nr:[Pyruvate dehydrogenase [acetyl-transferring]]-phosphatase 1, mitochondrial [Operophtera brumata]